MAGTIDDTDVAGVEHGRAATAPHEIPSRGWRDIALRVRAEMADDRLDMVAASVAFWATFALFPAMIALVSLYGLIADPSDVAGHVAQLGRVLPREVATILDDQMRAIVSSSDRALSIGVVVSIAGALWAASGGMDALIAAIEIVYEERPRPGLLRRKAVSVGYTLAAIAMTGVVVLLVGVLPVVFAWIGLGDFVRALIDLARWPILAVLVMLAVSLLYRYAPHRTRAKWRWVTWGSVIATALSIGTTALFSVLVAAFGRFNETYGALAGVVVLMFWLYITALVILLGAEIDAEIEHQTAVDSTVGEPAPMGERGAAMADTLGRAYD